MQLQISALQTALGQSESLQIHETDVRGILERISSPTGEVNSNELLVFLREEGLAANNEEVEEMISMLDEEPRGLGDATIPAPAASRAQLGDSERQPCGEAELWQAFLDRSFAVGEQRVLDGVLERAAIEQRESYIFLALPALVFLDMIEETARRHRVEPDVISFGSNMAVTGSTCPPSWSSVVSTLVDVRTALNAAVDDPTLVGRLRLACAADPSEGGLFDDNEPTLTRLRGLLEAAATKLTQTDRFRGTFEGVFVLIEAVCEK